jgi:three-Cys-motif partner protein
MKAIEFFQKIKPWSRRKHRLLLKYLPPFSAKVATTTRNRQIYCIDAFAGAAKYDDGSEGSPILIGKVSDDCATWRNPVVLNLINVEPDIGNEGIFDSLQNATRYWVEAGTVMNIRKEFYCALPEIAATVGNSPALFFIDPFGPTQVHFEHLEPLLKRSQKITELIINFDTDGLYRIAKASLSPNTSPRVAKSDAQNVTKIIGSADWMRRLDGSSDEGRMLLLHEYMSNLGKFDYYVVGYPIRESLKKRAEYYFVYCTRHRDGIGLMNDFIREEEDLLYGEHVETSLPLFQEEASLSNVVDSRRVHLKVLVENYLKDHDIVTRGQIKSELLLNNFGHFHSKDFNFVVKGLIQERILLVDGEKSRINDNDILRYVAQS